MSHSYSHDRLFMTTLNNHRLILAGSGGPGSRLSGPSRSPGQTQRLTFTAGLLDCLPSTFGDPVYPVPGQAEHESGHRPPRRGVAAHVPGSAPAPGHVRAVRGEATGHRRRRVQHMVRADPRHARRAGDQGATPAACPPASPDSWRMSFRPSGSARSAPSPGEPGWTRPTPRIPTSRRACLSGVARPRPAPPNMSMPCEQAVT